MSYSHDLKESSDFSLVLGGPLYQLFLRSRITTDSLGLLKRRVIVISLVAWLPLLVLSALAGQAVDGGIEIPFLYDVEAHTRFLLALPLLVVAELVVHQRIRPIVLQFLERGIVPMEAQPGFQAIIGSAMRLRNSVAIEVVCGEFQILGEFTG
jgi:hypothetical protein